MDGRPRVVVIGAGFGGLAVARALRAAPIDVTLVDQHNFHLFQPLLYQVATAGLDPDNIAKSVRAIVRDQPNVAFRLATVTAVDWDLRQLHVVAGDSVLFDYLVVAAGAATASFGVPGVDQHAFGLKTLDDAVRLRSHVLRQFELADAHPELIADGALTIAIVGGGPTGVELAGAFAELFSRVLARDFPRLEVGRARLVLIEATDEILSVYHEPSREHARRTLEARGVAVWRSSAVERITPGSVELRGRPPLPTRTVVWAAGVQAAPLGAALGGEQTAGGRVVVTGELSIPGHRDAFVIGDMAAARDPAGGLYPQVAPVAIQQARHVAGQVLADLSGASRTPFAYRNPGTMATIGRNAAVAELPHGIRLRGLPAWVMWLVLHLVQLIGFRNRASVLLDWAWNYLTYDRSARLITDSMSNKSAGDRLA